MNLMSFLQQMLIYVEICVEIKATVYFFLFVVGLQLRSSIKCFKKSLCVHVKSLVFWCDVD